MRRLIPMVGVAAGTLLAALGGVGLAVLISEVRGVSRFSGEAEASSSARPRSPEPPTRGLSVSPVPRPSPAPEREFSVPEKGVSNAPVMLEQPRPGPVRHSQGIRRLLRRQFMIALNEVRSDLDRCSAHRAPEPRPGTPPAVSPHFVLQVATQDRRMRIVDVVFEGDRSGNERLVSCVGATLRGRVFDVPRVKAGHHLRLALPLERWASDSPPPDAEELAAQEAILGRRQ